MAVVVEAVMGVPSLDWSRQCGARGGYAQPAQQKESAVRSEPIRKLKKKLHTTAISAMQKRSSYYTGIRFFVCKPHIVAALTIIESVFP
ncbi:MAG: hypothetical protein WBG17_01370 [Burkholderiaceae bacterium]